MMQSEMYMHQLDRSPVDTWHHTISPATVAAWHDRRDETMSDNAEAGIAGTQAAVAKSKGAAGLKEHHNWNIAYLNERILVSLMAIATLGVIVLWATATSKLVIYGSFAVVIAPTF